VFLFNAILYDLWCDTPLIVMDVNFVCSIIIYIGGFSTHLSVFPFGYKVGRIEQMQSAVQAKARGPNFVFHFPC
jgi:hypothetical protein